MVASHRCPLCHEICETKVGTPPTQKGRPPTAQRKLVDYLRTHGSAEKPVQRYKLQAAMNASENYLKCLVSRARKSGYNIRTIWGEGYWLGAEEESNTRLTYGRE